MNTNYFTGFDQKYDEGLEFFIDNLPHGSGIDCDWGGDVKGNSVKISNSYHCMDEWGGYDGYQDFTLVFDKKDFFRMLDCYGRYHAYKLQSAKDNEESEFHFLVSYLANDFKLQFNNGDYKARKYQLREYLEETINYDISEMGFKEI